MASGSKGTKRRFLGILVTVVAIVVAVPTIALAAWVATGTGKGYTAAVSMPTGNKPTLATTGRNVTVSWTASNIVGSTHVSGYVIRRFDAATDTSQTVGAACSGTVATLTCTEAAVPSGTWYYEVTPAQGPWTGAPSIASANVTIASPSLTFSSSTVMKSLPTTLSGTVASFATGETLAFRLDDPVTGTLLTSTVTSTPIPANGQSAVTVKIPVGTTDGPHTVYAVGSLGTQASAGITVDKVAPTLTVAISKTFGFTPAFIAQGGTYYVYANVADPSPSSGIATVTANVTNITAGATVVPMMAGSYTAGGAAYNYRSTGQLADILLSTGNKSFSVTATDVAGNTKTQNGTVTVDNTPPTATKVLTANGGGTAGKIEVNDTITYTFSEAMDPDSILSGWTGTATTVDLRLVSSAGGDFLQVWDSTNTTLLPLNQLNLGRTDYLTADSTITATMTQATTTVVLKIASVGAGISTAAGTGTTTWVSTAGMYDRAGNGCLPAIVTETGAPRKDF
jgi:hypothetical protein